MAFSRMIFCGVKGDGVALHPTRTFFSTVKSAKAFDFEKAMTWAFGNRHGERDMNLATKVTKIT
jgi:hypothetical protein